MMPPSDPVQALAEIKKEIQDKFDEAGMSKVEEFTDKLDDMITALKKGPTQLLDKAKNSVGELKDKLVATTKDPSSLAPEGGGMATCASWYGNSVAGKLEELGTKANDMSESVAKMATDLAGPLSSLESTLNDSMKKLEDSVKALAKLPKLVAQETQGVTSPDAVAKIKVDPMKKALSGGDVDGPLNAIVGLKNVLGDCADVAKRGIEKLKEFVAAAPDMVKSAFDVPTPLCFLQGVLLSQAPKAMTDLLDLVGNIDKIDLQPLIDMMQNVTTTIGGLDINMVKAPMAKFKESAGPIVDKLENVVKGAALSQNPTAAMSSMSPFS